MYKLLLFMLWMVSFWGMLNGTLLQKLIPLINLFAIVYFVTNYNYINSVFKKPLLVFLICLIINWIGVWALRGQDIINSFRGPDSVNFTSIFILFIFERFKISLEQAERVMYHLFWIFIFCYLLQWVIFPYPLFYAQGDGALEGFLNNNHIRYRLAAQGINFLAMFYSFYKLIVKYKLADFLLFVLTVIVAIMFEFRSQLAILPIALVFLMYKYSSAQRAKNILILTTILSFTVFIGLQTDFVSDKFSAMLERNEGQNFGNTDYIRYLCYDYYTSIQESLYDIFFGLGLTGIDGNYTKFIGSAKESGYIWADWGLIGLSWMLGIPGVLCLIWYSLKCFRLSWKFDIQYGYIGIWFLYLILIGTFNREFYRTGLFAIQALALYIFDKSLKQKNESRNINFSSRT